MSISGERVALYPSTLDTRLFQTLSYKRYEKFLLYLAEKNQIAPKTVVSAWKPVFCEDNQLAHSINIRHLQYPRDLYVLASSNVIDKCAIPLTHPRHS